MGASLGRTVVAAFGIPVGLFLGFVAAGLATEPAEELGGSYVDGQIVKALAILGVAGLLSGWAFRRRATAWAPLLATLAVAMPSWVVMMGDEIGAPGLALAIAWSGLLVLGAVTERAALIMGGLFAAFMSPAYEGQWITLVLVLGLAAAAFAPLAIRRPAAPVGAIASMGLAIWIAWPDALEQAQRGDLWVLGLMAAGCIAVATAAATLHRSILAPRLASP